MLHKSDYQYDLPPELIAQFPLENRTGSRLLRIMPAGDARNSQSSDFEDSLFSRLGEYLRPGDLLVFNNTRVIPARLYGQKESGGKVEVMIERLLDQSQALAQIRANKSPKPGGRIQVSPEHWLRVVERRDDFYRLELEGLGNLLEVLESTGHIPLPPYIDREDQLDDRERYQTVFAQVAGAVAAPTAGLHFDQNLIDALLETGVETSHLTLHVGAGTYQPMRANHVSEHKMHSEYIDVPDQTVQKILETKARGNRVIAVGTTSVRSLETAARTGKLAAYQGETDIFIYPGFPFRVIDGMITNFHLPESTLLMLVCAFGGYERIMAAYRHAIAMRYRFFSYGDAMLLL